MFHIGRARLPGPGPRDFPPGQLSVEFINVGGWLTSGDLALDSCAQFLAVTEQRLIPSRARSVCHHSAELVIILFGPLPVKNKIAVVMLGWCYQSGWCSPILHLSLLSFRVLHFGSGY